MRSGYLISFRIAALATALVATACRAAESYDLVHEFGRALPVADKLVDDGAGNLYGVIRDGADFEQGAIVATRSDGTATRIVHAFGGDALDGAYPGSLVLVAPGKLAGTTSRGGAHSQGTIFVVNSDGSGYELLYSFAATETDGALPYSLVFDGDHTLFGITTGGPPNESGAVFRIDTDGSGFAQIHSFSGGSLDARTPFGLTRDSSGALYGISLGGGSAETGTVFRLLPDGSNFELLHVFDTFAVPNGDLAFDGQGNVFGSRQSGGSLGGAQVFRMTTTGAAFEEIHAFAPMSGSPDAGLKSDGGDLLYGAGNGQFFSMHRDGSGFAPISGYTVNGPPRTIVLSGPTIFGTTNGGGAGDRGVVFKIDAAGGPTSVLFNFGAMPTEGAGNSGGVDVTSCASALSYGGDGYFYGTTCYGGALQQGVVYRVARDGSGFSVLHSFDGASEGSRPSTLVSDGAGNLYGTTNTGGYASGGTLFRMRTDGTGFQVLFSHSLGYVPGALTFDASGTLYGATKSLNGGFGSLFSYTVAGGYFGFLTFTGAATGPSGSLLVDSGRVYGVVEAVAPNDKGGVYSVRTDGGDFKLLHSFAADGHEGIRPLGGLQLDATGTLYGTTSEGPTFDHHGTVYRVKTDGSGFAILRDFVDTDGGRSVSALTLVGGRLYGVLSYWGANLAGTLFTMNTDGSAFAVKHDFDYLDAFRPESSLTSSNADGTELIGVSFAGGLHGTGAVYRVSVEAIFSDGFE